MNINYGIYQFMNLLAPILFVGIFVIVIGTFVVAAVKGVGTWARNNAQPVIDADATVVSRREDIRRGANHHRYTTYYVTFEMEDRNRQEFAVSGREYGQISEGDYGQLTFQGTRFLGFRRVI